MLEDLCRFLELISPDIGGPKVIFRCETIPMCRDLRVLVDLYHLLKERYCFFILAAVKICSSELPM